MQEISSSSDAGNFSIVLPVWRQANHHWARASQTTSLHMRRSAMLAASPVVADWMVSAPKMEGTRLIDWCAIPFDDALECTLRVFRAAHVPAHVRDLFERSARATQLTDERKAGYQHYLDQLAVSRRGFGIGSASRARAGTKRTVAQILAELRTIVQKVRDVSAFHRHAPNLGSVPRQLVPAQSILECLGDLEDGVRLDTLAALEPELAKGVFDATSAHLTAFDEWLAMSSTRARSESFATGVGARLALEHLAARLGLLRGGVEVNAILERVNGGESLSMKDQEGLYRIAVAARSGTVVWALDARDVSRTIAPQCDDFAPLLNDVFDADTVNNLFLFKAERGLGHRKLVTDCVPPELVPLLPYAELLDVGGDVGTHVVASLGLTQRSSERLLKLADPLRTSLHELVWSDWVDGPPRYPEWLAMFALNNVLNHLEAPEDARRDHSDLFAAVAGR